MRNFIKLSVLAFFAAITVFAQDNFVSVDGGFAISLPKTFSSSKDYDGEYSNNMYTNGKIYYWQKENIDPFFAIQYSKYQSADFGKPTKLTLKNKNEILNAYRKGFIEKAKELKSIHKETVYSFEQNSGKELFIVNSTSKTLIRIFFVKNTLYSIVCVFSILDKEESLKDILNSFRLLTRQEIIDIKVKLAEPKPLPQSPVSDKPFSDAYDNNLKRKAKTIFEEYQEAPNKKREKWSEAYYNEQGNLTREVGYGFGYPNYITVWGYIDGNRVNDENETNISFDDDPKGLSIIQDATAEYKALPKDERYGTKYTYKYNSDGQLSERVKYFNSGVKVLIENFSYVGNRRETTNLHEYPENNKYSAKSIQMYDKKNGDLIEETQYDYEGKFMSKTSYKYELDTKGNWIVQKSFDNVKVKGKNVLKPSSIIYRTITYYD